MYTIGTDIIMQRGLSKTSIDRVPAVEQWVKNLTAAAQVPVEAQVRSLARHSGLKDLALPELWQLQLGFNPWPRNFHMPCLGAAIKK